MERLNKHWYKLVFALGAFSITGAVAIVWMLCYTAIKVFGG